MKPRKAARRRKRPDRTPLPPQQLTRSEKTFLKSLLWVFVVFCLYNGYAYWFNYSIRQRKPPASLGWLGIPYPHVWLMRQWDRFRLPIREAAAQSGSQPNERIYYIHSDHLGSPLILTDTNAQVVWRANAEPFGKTTPTVNQIVYNPRFPGQYEVGRRGSITTTAGTTILPREGTCNRILTAGLCLTSWRQLVHLFMVRPGGLQNTAAPWTGTGMTTRLRIQSLSLTHRD